MKFSETKLKGAFIVETEKVSDTRGFFARTWCKKEFGQNKLNTNLVQISVGFNTKKYTIRGMHYQLNPYSETKLVRCSMGSIYDVIIDLRQDSETYKQWFSVELKAEEYKMVYVPEGFAHGYQTLEDNTEVIYHISEFHYPDYYRGVRWDDPAFGIKWPSSKDVIISEKDKNYSLFQG